MDIYIFGLGAIGSNLLLQLIKKYQDFQFHGIDFDSVEDRNMNTQAYFLNHINMPKAQALIPIIGTKIRKFKYRPITKMITDIESIKDVVKDSEGNKYVIIDCFDNMKSRMLFNSFRGNILHVGFSPQYAAEVIWHEEYSSPNDLPAGEGDICVMAEAVPFINFVVSLAAFAVSDYIDNNIKTSYIVTNKHKIISL